MKLLFTPESERQATEMDAWWREHRPGVADLFARELAQVGDLIAVSPSVSVTYTTSGGPRGRGPAL